MQAILCEKFDSPNKLRVTEVDDPVPGEDGPRRRRFHAQAGGTQHGARERTDDQTHLGAARRQRPDHPGDPHLQAPLGRTHRRWVGGRAPRSC